MPKNMKRAGAAMAAALVLTYMAGTASAGAAYAAAEPAPERTVTRAEAAAWLDERVGQSIDYDGAYGAQNTDLIKAYYEFLGATPVSGSAGSYRTNELPGGFERIRDGSPLPGDILVYTGGYYGHVAVYESDHVSFHQGFGTDSVIRLLNDYREIGGGLTYWGLIRPAFPEEPFEAEDPGTGPEGTGITTPGKIRQGDGFMPEGTVTDTEMLSEVTAGVYLPDGQEIFAASAAPEAQSFDLSGLEGEKGTDALVPGIYEYRVTASDPAGTKVLASEVFTVTSGTKTIPDGLYRVESDLKSGMMLSVAGRSSLPGANIRLFTFLPYDLSQDFYFTYEAEGYYTVKNRQSGLYMTLGEARADGSRPLIQKEQTGGDEQLFQVLTDGTDRWYLVPKTEENLLIRTAGGAAYNSADTDAGPATLGGECRFTLYDSFSGFRDVQGEARGQ